jgi:superkiller protein 3
MLDRYGKPEEVLALYRKGIAASPQSIDLYQFFGDTLRSKGKLDEATTIYRHAIQKGSQNSETYLSLLEILKEQNKKDEIRVFFHKLIEIDPRYYVSAATYLEDEDALVIYREAIARNPKDPQPYELVGSNLWIKGRYAEAVTIFRKLSELKPQDPGVRASLHDSLEKAGSMMSRLRYITKRLKPS